MASNTGNPDDLTSDPRMPTLLATALPPFSPGQIPQFEHRLQLLKHLNIVPGSQLLEIGCGQGDATIALADAVGSAGSVTAIDPAPLDYGSPYTLGQAQGHIRSTPPLGPRIRFVQSDPITYVQQLPASQTAFSQPTTAVLIHSLWYFSSRSHISNLFSTLGACPSIKRLLIAEYSLRSSEKSQIPHVLAAKAQSLLSEASNPVTNESNIRTAVTPDEILDLASRAGWKMENLGFITPSLLLQDGRWEVGLVASETFNDAVAKEFSRSENEGKADGRERVMKLRQEMFDALAELGGEAWAPGKKGWLDAVRCMDTWWAEFRITDEDKNDD